MKTVGLVLSLALLASGCATSYVTGYGLADPSGDREERIGHYASMEQCRQDPRVTRCEPNPPHRSGTDPSVFLPGGVLR
jgi:hypothetical protein